MAQKRPQRSQQTTWKMYTVRYMEEHENPSQSVCVANATDMTVLASSKRQAVFGAKRYRGDERRAMNFQYGDGLICGYGVLAEKPYEGIAPPVMRVLSATPVTMYEDYRQREAYHRMRAIYGPDKIRSFQGAAEFWYGRNDASKPLEPHIEDTLVDGLLTAKRSACLKGAREKGFEGSYTKLVRMAREKHPSKETTELIKGLWDDHLILGMDRRYSEEIDRPAQTSGKAPQKMLVLPDGASVVSGLRKAELRVMAKRIEAETGKTARQLFEEFDQEEQPDDTPDYE